MYLALKHIHLTFVVLSFLVFFIRGIGLFMNSPLLHKKISKILPHIINTIMLVSGVVLAVHLGMKPGEQPWLIAKIVGLVFFVIIGIAVFKVKKSVVSKVLWLDALLIFIYIVSVAITKNPMPFLI